MIKKFLFVSPRVLILAIVIRLILAGTTFHADLNAFALAGGYIASGKILNFYDAVRLLPVGDPIKTLYTDKIFNYQPLSYLLPALFYLPMPHLTDLRTILPTLPFAPLLIFYKLPFIIFDLSAALVIVGLADDKNVKRRLQLLWLYNPAAIFVSSLMGQSDMMVVFFLILAAAAARREKFTSAAAFCALSALFKPAGLFLLPLVALAAFGRSFNTGLKSLVAGTGIYLAGILPYLFSISFRTYALLAEQTGKSTFAGITIAAGTSIPWFFIAYAAIAILLARKRLALFDALGLALAASLVFSHFHPQWFVWLTPWLIIKAVTGRTNLYLYLTALAAWLIILLSFDLSLHLASLWWLGLTPNQYLFPGNQNFANLVLLARAFLIPVFFLL